MVANRQLDNRNHRCKRTYHRNGMTTNTGGTTRPRIGGNHSSNTSTGKLCLIYIVLVTFPALCAPELVVREDDDDFGAIWRNNSFNLDPNGANVCTRTSLRLATSLLSSDAVTSMCESIYSPATCDALWSGIISTDELYLPLVSYTCCDGFQREASACSIVCPIDTFGQDCSSSCNCQNGATCNPKNGSCQCGPGWRGSHCDLSCPPDRYGYGCEDVCDCQNGGSCHQQTGSCLCPSGSTGNSCEINCSTSGFKEPGCSNDFHCERCVNIPPNQPCDPTLGSCICADGWLGRFCNHTCQGSTHGSFCHDKCDCGKNASYCQPVDGRCECRPGWKGDKCDQECPPGSFGEQCRRSCSCPDGAVCDHEDGGCDCPAGWKGQVCVLPCTDDEWGAGCTQGCNCSDDQDCEPIRGRCFSPDDYQAGSPTTPTMTLSNPDTITIIAASAGVAVAVIAIVITIVVTLRCRKKRTPRRTPGLSLNNGVQNGTAGADQTKRHSEPTPPSRDPSTLLPSRTTSERESQWYESIPETRRPNSYLEVCEDQIDNPLYAPGSSGYEVPTPNGTLERGIDSRHNPGRSRSRVANPLYGGNAGYEVPTPQGTLERGIDSRQNTGQSQGQIANPLYSRNTGYEVPTPQGTLERAVDGSADDGGYTHLTAPSRVDNYEDLKL